MNMYKGHMDKTKRGRIKGGKWGWPGWGRIGGGKMETTVLEQQFKECEKNTFKRQGFQVRDYST